MKKLIFILVLLFNGVVSFGQSKSDIIKEIDNIINLYGSEYKMEYPGNRQTVSEGLTSSVADGLYCELDNERETDENGNGGYHYSFSGAHGTSVKADELFHDWDRVLRKYQNVISDFSTRLSKK